MATGGRQRRRRSRQAGHAANGNGTSRVDPDTSDVKAETAEAERVFDQFPFDREVVPPLPSGRLARTAARTAARSTARTVARVAVTGSGGYWGRHLVQALEGDAGVEHLVGIDSKEPPGRFAKARFFDVDVQEPWIVDVLTDERVDVVVHLDTAEALYSAEEVFERNVLGTMHLLSACARAGVRRVIVRSHGKVYGARPDNPNFLTEEMPLRAASVGPHIRDRIEIEKYCRKFQRLHPNMELVVLRTANVIGPTCQTQFTEYLRGRFVPTVVGFDPLGQVVHEEDVVKAFHLAVRAPVQGPVNVAAPPALPLSKIIRLAGKVPLPVLTPLAYPLLGLARHYHLANFTADARDYIKFSWVMDTSRMQEDLGLVPRHSAIEALREFAQNEWTRLYT